MEYAAVSDLICEVQDATIAQKLIARASRKIENAYGGEVPGELADTARDVCCAMVERVLLSYNAGLNGLSQVSETEGPFTWSGTISNPLGNLYLTKDEKRSLGLTAGSIGFARPSYGVLEADDEA